MKNIKELHKKLKRVRKESEFKKKVSVPFIPNTKEGFGVIAVKPDIGRHILLNTFSEEYSGKGILLVEQDCNPYTFLTYKEVNKIFKEIKENKPSAYENDYLLMKELDGSTYIVTDVVTSSEEIGMLCYPIFSKEYEEDGSCEENESSNSEHNA